MATMKSGGIVAVSDDGKCVQDARLMLSCMKYASNFGLPIIIHPEDYSLAGKGVKSIPEKLLPSLVLVVFRVWLKKLLLPGILCLLKVLGAQLHIAHISICPIFGISKKCQR